VGKFASLRQRALGDALANFYDLGGKHLTIASFAFANLGGIGGRVMSGPYLGLVNANTYANPSGNLVAVAPTDPIFSGITLSNVPTTTVPASPIRLLYLGRLFWLQMVLA
jgi:hypothetical protein